MSPMSFKTLDVKIFINFSFPKNDNKSRFLCCCVFNVVKDVINNI